MKSPSTKRAATNTARPTKRKPKPRISEKDAQEMKEIFTEQILPLLNGLHRKHRKQGGTGERPRPFCGGRLQYRVANKGMFIACQCDKPGCFYLIT